MSLTVVTGWSPEGYELYGRTFVESFERFWPNDVRLIAYVEQRRSLMRAEQILVGDIPEIADFLKRHQANAEARGRQPTHRWSAKSRARGYDYRFDAHKFGRVPLYLRHAAAVVREGPMIWLDGDVVTFAPVTPDLIEDVLPPDVDVSFLGRYGKHSEIGFQGYRLPGALPFINAFADWYTADAFWALPEWHSAYCFDETMRRTPGRYHNLTPGGSGHVWFQSPLGDVMDHLKGDKRKVRGRSAERPAHA